MSEPTHSLDRVWDIKWGILDPEETLRQSFGCSGPFNSTGKKVTFCSPLYPSEENILFLYIDATGRTVAIGELTPSVYAAGVKLSP